MIAEWTREMKKDPQGGIRNAGFVLWSAEERLQYAVWLWKRW
jgi:hypothetical protein